MLKQLNKKSVSMSIAYIILGILLVVFPDVSADILSYIVGSGLIILGVVNLTTYFVLDVKVSLFRNEFVIGLVCLIFGLIVILKKDLLMSLIPVILGLFITVSGFMNIQRAIVAKRIGYDKFNIYIILGVISIVAGIAIMFFVSGRTTQNIIFTVIGISLIYSGGTDLGIQFFLAGKFNQYLHDFDAGRPQKVIDVETTETTSEPNASTSDDETNG